MSDVGLLFGPRDYIVLALLFGSPGLVVGAGLGALACRQHRIIGTIAGAGIGVLLCLGGVYLKVVLD